MKKITSINELKKRCSTEAPTEFFVSLAGGFVRSSKSIMLTENGDFDVLNEIDGTRQTLTAERLFTQSNIGEAIVNGAFYAC